ncbi:MAG TPA: FtsX-like permease family protein [Actinomycetota bacterium]
MLRAALKSLLARKLRLLLTGFSVVLGVGFVAGTYVLTDTMNAAFDEVFDQVAVGADVIVRSESAFDPIPAGPGGGGNEGRNPVPDSLLGAIAALPEVDRASGDVSGYAQLVDPETGEAIGGFGPPTIGTNWSEGASDVVELREGEPPTSDGEVVIDAGTAERVGLSIGDEIEILFEGPPEAFTIVGIAGFGEADNLAGATLALFDTTTAQRVLDKEGVFDGISVSAAEGVSPVQLREAIAPLLPSDVEVVTSTDVADEQSEALKEGLSFFRTALLVFALISLFVGAFIIFNTFSIIVAQRSRELALMRAIGASRRQVVTSVVVEALVIGLVASVVGILVGIGIAVGLKAILGAIGIDLPSTTTQVLPRTIVVSIAVGTIVTVVSSVLPARRAGRVLPIEALRESQQADGGGGLGRRLALGAVVLLVGVAALAFGLFGDVPNPGAVIGAGAAATFVGIAMLSPLAARPVARSIGVTLGGAVRLADPVVGALRRGRSSRVQRTLGRENAMRNPRRTAATASALMIGLGLVSMVAILTASLKASIDVAIADTLKADFTVVTSSFIPFSPAAADRLREVPEVEAVSEFRQGGARQDETTVFLTAIDPATVEEVATLDVTAGSVADLAGEDTVMLYTDLADELGLGVGDTLELAFATTGRTELRVVGIFAENAVVQGEIAISLATHASYFTERLDAWIMVTAAPGVEAAAAQTAMEDALSEDFRHLEVQDQTTFREQQVGFIDQLLNLVTALLSLAILIALFGIANTLGLSILERTRELGLLRAVGMSRAQVRRMVRWEAVIVAVMGALFGIAIGLLFGWALQRALEPEGVTELAIPTGQLIGYLVFAAIAGVLTAIGPARRAANLDVLRSIAYE